MNTFFMAATLVMLTTIVSAAEKNLYVSPEGKDSNPGTEALPFLTITKARDHIRGLAKTAPRGNIVVFLRGGIYRVEKTIVFGEADTAVPGQTITYRAYPGETPVLSASVPINGWNKEKLASGKMVWSADVSALLARRGQVDFCGVGALDSRAKTSFFTLYDAEGELPRARGPGFQAKPLPEADEKSTDKIYFPKGALKPWTDLPGAELVIIPRYHWNMNILPLAAVDPQGFATTARPGTYPLAPNPITERPTVWVENVLDVLDEPGEWVLHPAQGKLYLLPRAGQPKEIEAPLLTELIRVQGGVDYEGPVDRPIRGLVFQGLTFTRGDRLPWCGQTGLGVQHDWEMFDLPTALVRFRSAEECAILDCCFTDAGHAGVRADLHAQKIRIEGSVFERLGGAAILFAGYGPGTKDVNRKNIVVNNHIHHTGRHYWGTPAVMIWQSGENRIAHNRIHHVPYAGIALSGRIPWNRTGNAECVKTIRWHEVDTFIPKGVRPEWPERERFLHARRNLVDRNEIHNAVEICGDGNALYVSGSGDGNIVRENYCHDFYGDHMNAIIRNDDFQNGTSILGNILCRTRGNGEGIINKGANRIIGNVIADLRPTKGTRGAVVLTGYAQHGAVIRNNLVYAPRIARGAKVRGWPAISETEGNVRERGASLLKDTDADSNLYWCAEDPAWGKAHLTKARRDGKELHSIAADPCFADPDLSTFALQQGSPALRLGITPFDVTLAGPQEPYRSRWFGKNLRTIITPAGTVTLEAPLEVSIRATRPDAVIRYTLDGSEPDERAAIYQKPLRIDAPVRVRARSFATGYEDLAGDMTVLEAPSGTPPKAGEKKEILSKRKQKTKE
jgi:hypothetical protein